MLKLLRIHWPVSQPIRAQHYSCTEGLFLLLSALSTGWFSFDFVINVLTSYLRLDHRSSFSFKPVFNIPSHTEQTLTAGPLVVSCQPNSDQKGAVHQHRRAFKASARAWRLKALSFDSFWSDSRSDGNETRGRFCQSGAVWRGSRMEERTELKLRPEFVHACKIKFKKL